MIVLDTETGGLNPQTDALVSVCLLRLENNEAVSLYIKPVKGLVYGAEAEAVHGLSRETLEKKGAAELEVMQAVAGFCEKWPDEDWLGCNPYFDRGFLAAAMERNGLKARLPRRMVDLQSVAWLCDRMGLIELPRKKGAVAASASLDGILQSLGLSRAKGVHTALEDCLLTARVWRRLWALVSTQGGRP
jgi:DNA polymerase III epsilon subunit-like protein